MRLRRITAAGRCAALVLVMCALAGCGEGYVIVPAILNVTGITDQSKGPLLSDVTGLLRHESFEDLGRYDEMISLQKQMDTPEDVKARELARLYRERTYLKDSSHLRVIWSDYSNEAEDKSDLRYTPPDSRFIELSIYEERPGGFSAAGQQFYDRFFTALQQRYGTAVVVAKTPPVANEAEYRRITRKNAIFGAIDLFIAVLLPLAVTGPLSNLILRKRVVSRWVKRLIFVVANTWLVAPLPFQGGFIFEFPGPNLLAFPWTYLGFYKTVAPFAAISFPCAALVCVVISPFLFKPLATPTQLITDQPA